MYLHKGKKLVYLAHPKTASHATLKALRSIGFEDEYPIRGHHANLHPSGLEVRWGAPREEWCAFTTIRNHWDWAVSLSFASPNPQFDLESLKKTLKPCFYLAENEIFALHSHDADIILQYECIEEDLNWVLEMNGLGPVELEIVRPTVARLARPYQEFYTPDTRSYIAERFADEIERFGYKF